MIPHDFIHLLFWLLVAHAVCDFPLQGDFLSRAKNHRAPIEGVPWWIALAAHSAIHAGAVALVTGSLWLGLAEFLVHSRIDYEKCDERFGFAADQCSHMVWKLVWASCVFIPALLHW